MTQIKRVAVLTSGGDAPGMNAAIRAVVRKALQENLEVYGVLRGYEGLIKGDFIEMNSKSVANIIQTGGTILKTARSEVFKTEEGRKLSYKNLKKAEIDALVVIGGDGTLKGARALVDEYNFPVVGIPGTIDNDLFGTDMTIGYDTALNTVMTAVDKIRDTAMSHDRMFFVEVMGRDAGFIALRSCIAGGAEAALIPEVETDINALHEKLLGYMRQKKTSCIIIVAEGDDAGGAFKIKERLQEFGDDFDMKVTVLGHTQRGGSPTSYDRYLASRLGIAAIEALIDDQRSIMVGMINNEIVHVPFNKTIKHHRTIDQKMLEIINTLNT
ncbi:MAG: 6-phosphofructokinase [Bacteroidales bacterium]|jgi:6-phosphofructokinase 1|nr:6-phosphofructokinase [Bacteroidales bacterium]